MQFDFIAPYYDSLSRFIFGKTLEKAKTTLFDEIKDGSKVLVVGGGTGESIKGLVSSNYHLQIDFVEASEKMISKARNGLKNFSNVNFYHTQIEQFEGTSYDVIITEFFFDLFEEKKVKKLINILGCKLNKKGKWIDTDFRKPINLRQVLVLKAMYIFFKITASISSNYLVDTNPIIKKAGYIIKREIKFSSNFISSRLILPL